MSSIPAGAAAPLVTLWTQRASQVLGGAAAAITASGLTDKFYRVSGVNLHTASAILPGVRFNNDGGSNYVSTIMYGQPNGTTFTGSQIGPATYWYIQTSSTTNDAADNPAVYELLIGKPIAAQKGRGLNVNQLDDGAVITGPWPFFGAVMWTNTADLITRIDMIAGSSTFKAGSHMTVEGFV